MEAYLYLEAHIKAIESATDFTYKWCTGMGMTADEAARFTLAVDELLTNMILFAYPETDGYIELWYKYSVPQLEIIIQESGEPFDPDQYHYSPEKAMAEDDFEGAGLELVRSLTDHFLFLNRGKQGKEFRLVKQLAEKNLAAYEKDEEPEADEHVETKNYELQTVTTRDAEDIAKLIYRSYQYAYSKEGLYFPKQNELAIEHGKKFGVIIRTGTGRPVGYFSVNKDPGSLVGEVGEAVVSPAHRQKGLMTRMLEELIGLSKRRGLMGLYGLALTVHTISQRVNQTFGFKSTALLVGVTLGSRYKEVTDNPDQPASLVVDFLPFTEKARAGLHFPDRYRDILLEIYRELNFDVSSPTANKNSSDGRKTEMELQFTYRNKTANIVVSAIGSQFITNAKSMLRSLDELKLNGIYIDIPLQDRPTHEAVEWLHRNGFIFAGLMPLKYREKDYLRMQKVLTSINPDPIVTYSEMAKKLKKIIFDEYYELQQEE